MPSKMKSILLGAAVYVAASLLLQLLVPGMGVAGAGGAIIVALVGCLVMLALGSVPVWHYTRAQGLDVSAGSGAGMGAGSIALGAIVMALVTWMLVEAGVSPDPRVSAEEQGELQGLSEAEIDMLVSISHPLISGGLGVLMGAIAGAIGGAIGASIFRRDEGGWPEEPLG